MENKQTAVEWLLEHDYLIRSTKWPDIVEQALAMEKEQIINSRENGISEGYRRTNNFYYDKMVDSEQYYNKIYGSKTEG